MTTAWIGSILLALCGLPQAYRSYTDGHSRGISSTFLVMWGLGEILTFFYIIGDLPLMINYGINIICISVIIKYKLKERNDI